MFSIGGIADKIATNLADSLHMSSEKKDVMAYGIFGFLQVSISILLVAFFGLLFDVFIEGLIIAFSISILRKYSGGAHSSTSNKCLIVGTVICIVPAIIIHNFSINFFVLLFFCIIVFPWAYYKILTKAPVDSIKKPINNLQKRKKLKNGSLIITSFYLIIVIVCLSIYYFAGFSTNFLVYTTCILFGMTWQVFTLTKVGHRLYILLDKYLSINYKKIEGGE